MPRFNYRTVQINLDAKLPHPPQIEAALNTFGEDGWRVVSLEVAPRLAVNESSLWVLIERELDSQG